MPNLNLTNEQIKSHMFGMHDLAEHERHAASEAVIKLQGKDDWHPEALRRELHALQSSGKLTESARHSLEKKFFPGHSW